MNAAPNRLSEHWPSPSFGDHHGRVWVFVKRYGWWLCKWNGEWAVKELRDGRWVPKVDRLWLPYSDLPDPGVELRDP